MKRTTVKSDSILSVGYEKSQKVLEVQFKESKNIYDYFNVPSIEYERLIKADSMGNYFTEHIRDKFDYKKRK